MKQVTMSMIEDRLKMLEELKTSCYVDAESEEHSTKELNDKIMIYTNRIAELENLINIINLCEGD